MDIKPINMKRIYRSIIEQFVGFIKDGKLVPGQKLPSERTLAGMFNVSRASMREAFSAMEVIGLIEVRPGEGTFVTDLNIAPFINTIAPLFIKDQEMEDDLLEFRKMLELEAVRLVTEKADKKEIDKLLEPVGMMKDSIDKNDADLGARADIGFHRTLFSLSGNYIISKASECIGYILETSVKFNRAKILKNSDNALTLYEQHKGIYEAIMDGDAELAADIMIKHLDFVRHVS
jgi:GntR family transcriptional repressor for pyruvate dehydrogenase complex